MDRSLLKPLLNGLSMGRVATNDYTREMIRVEWRQGDPIDMVLVKPHGVEKPRVALYLYSYEFPGDLERFTSDAWCQHVTRNGLAAVGFLTALTGDRFRNRPMREWFIPELQESMGSSTHDVQLIVDYLASRSDLNVDRVGIFGQGSGASIAILSAAADPRIRAIDVVNPWGDWPDWLKGTPDLREDERPKLLTADFLQMVAPVDPVAWLPELKDRALRVQQVMDDEDTPPAARDKIAAAVPAGGLVQFKDMAAHREAWKATGLSGWLAAELLPASQSQAAPPVTASKPSQQ